jgi:hypothetical protein
VLFLASDPGRLVLWGWDGDAAGRLWLARPAPGKPMALQEFGYIFMSTPQDLLGAWLLPDRLLVPLGLGGLRELPLPP